jgi:hypothetical protein
MNRCGRKGGEQSEQDSKTVTSITQQETSMHLVQILLPLWSNSGKQFSKDLFDQVGEELVERFSGLTAYTRAPANGLWQESGGKTVHDDNIIYEVMVENLDRDWWAAYRAELENRFQQDKLIIRAQQITTL